MFTKALQSLNNLTGTFLYRSYGYLASNGDVKRNLYLLNPYNKRSYLCDPFNVMRKRLGFGKIFMIIEKAFAIILFAPVAIIAWPAFKISTMILRGLRALPSSPWQMKLVSPIEAPSNFKVVRSVHRGLAGLEHYHGAQQVEFWNRYMASNSDLD